MIALVPARSGSKRVPGKNIRLLNGVPLLGYSIIAAKGCGLFSEVYVSSDSDTILLVAAEYGAEPLLRVPRMATDTAPDILWVRDALNRLISPSPSFAILRPTSPFRTAATIDRAFRQFHDHQLKGESLRAVEPAKQTPFKMWERPSKDGPIVPVIARQHDDRVPFHSSPTQTLPLVYIQNSSLEMSLTTNVTEIGTIHGRTVWPFFTEGFEGLSIDTEADWSRAELIAATKPDLLPH